MANAILLVQVAVFAGGTIALVVAARGPRGGPDARAGVGVLALGLLGFAGSSFAISEDPTSAALRIVFIAAVCASILAAAPGCLLRSANRDIKVCSYQGSIAGTDVVTADGVHIAGWYIPAANRIGPTGATVVLVHGWADNKTQVLKYAVPFHPIFNVVAIDLRDDGRSGRSPTTFGLGERLDVEAVIDWLVRTRHPANIAVMGNSMGGATAMLAAAADERIEALILDSTHAHIMDVLSRSLEVDRGLPSFPGAPAILAGIWLRTGLDLEDADPTLSVAALGQRPLLLIHGGADVNDVPARSVALIYSAAQAAGVPVEMHICPAGAHGTVIDNCPVDWGQWAVDFLDRAFGLPTR